MSGCWADDDRHVRRRYAAVRAVNPWLIAVVVSMAAFMEVLDTTIANVALPYIGGGLAVSSDEASWVVTTYLVANAIALTASSFLAKRFGRKRFFLVCVVLFTISSVLCGLGLEPPVAAVVPHHAGIGRRRHGAGRAIDPGRRLPAREARPGLRYVRAWRWWWRPWSARRSAAFWPTMSDGNGASWSTARSASCRWRSCGS